MTKGKLAIFTDEGIFVTTEFNGDQYPGGRGDDSYRLIKGVNSLPDLQLASNVLCEMYGYDQAFVRCLAEKGSDAYAACCDFVEDYSRGGAWMWFSDYIYAKNIGRQPVELAVCKEGDPSVNCPSAEYRKLMPGEVIVINFGRVIPEEQFKTVKREEKKAPAKADNELLWNVLKEHWGHEVHIVGYGDEDDPANISLECEDCGCIILDAELYTIAARDDS